MELYDQKTAAFDLGVRMGVNFDSVKREFLYGGKLRAAFYFINGFSSGELFEKLFDYMLHNVGAADLVSDRCRFLSSCVPFADVCAQKEQSPAIFSLYSGSSVLIVEGFDGYIVLDTRHYPARGVEEPPNDKVLRGSRDGFCESLVPNSALIRRRIRDSALVFRKLTVGSATGTDLLICYMENAADLSYVDKVVSRISSVSTAGLNLGLESLSEIVIRRKRYNPFPKVRYTERPDAAAAMLMEGSVVILCDNYPAAMILPTTLFDFLQDTDDFYFPPLIGSYMKLVRNAVFALSLLLTPLWYTVQQVPQILPERLRFFLYDGESFLPLLFQLLLIEFAVDGLKLASLNTPDTLSNSLGVISALLIGDLAVHVGWLSEQVILYMAFVSIANFTQPSYELGYAFKFMRLLTLILISFLSYWGLFLGFALTVFLLATNNSADGGRGYLYPLIPLNPKALFRLFFRTTAAKEKCLQKGN